MWIDDSVYYPAGMTSADVADVYIGVDDKPSYRLANGRMAQVAAGYESKRDGPPGGLQLDGRPSPTARGRWRPCAGAGRRDLRCPPCTRRPPSAGPAAAPREPPTAQSRIECARCSAGIAVRIRPRLVGVRAAAPAACRQRNATMNHRSLLDAHPMLDR